MRSPFVWWLKRHWASFKRKVNDDLQFRVALVITAIWIVAITMLSINSYLLMKFLQP